MMVLAAYDVSVDSRRARLAALLQAVGDRVQRSVFVLEVSADDLADVRTRAATIIDPSTDSLFFFRQCSTCWQQLDVLGQASPPERVLYWAVL